VPLSFYTGVEADGTPVQDGSTEEDFPEDYFPNVPSSLGINTLRKPLNENRIRQFEQWAERSDDSEGSSSWSSEYTPTREAAFYTGEGAKNTPDIPLNPATPEILELEKKPDLPTLNILEPKVHPDKF
jgi:hypothetical protein